MKPLVEQVSVSEDALAFLQAQHPDSMDREEFLYFLEKPWKWQEEFSAWISERESARRTFRCSPEDVDESGGYALTNPKHERFHSVHADLYDSREGK